MNARLVNVEETGSGRAMAAMLEAPEKTCQLGAMADNFLHFVA